MINLSIRKPLVSAAGEMLLEMNLFVEKGTFLTLYGRSGAGKTSFLRILSGLMAPDEGHIEVHKVTWLDTAQKINLAPQRRKVGFVFQDYALFPNMTVKENLRFALAKGEDPAIVGELLEIMKLGELRSCKPQALSGGQKQRVALARALVQRPELLLLDEPLAALDRDMRATLQQYLLRVHRAYELTTILVSHDISEILKLSDQMVVLEEGKIIRQGKPVDLLSHHEVSGKFQLAGEVLAIERQDFLFIVTVLIGQELVKVVAEESEGQSLNVGDQVLVASKAFNPIIKKIN